MLNQTKQTSGRTKSSVIEVDLKNAYDASEYANLESYLSKLNGVHGFHLDRTRGVAHLTYDPSVTTAEQIAADLHGCGYKCECQSRGVSKCQPGYPPVGTRDQAGPVSIRAKSLETGAQAHVLHGKAGHAMEPSRPGDTTMPR